MIRARIPTFLRRNRHLRLGLSAALAVLVLLGGSSLLAQVRLGDKTIDAEFAQAAGLRPGATVDIAGIEVGAVQDVRLVNDRVVVALRIRGDIRLGSDARAAIKMSTILGRLHIDLHPGNGQGLPGNRIALENTTVPYNLSKVVQDPKYSASFERIERIDATKLRSALDVLNTQLGDSPAMAVQALDSIGSLAQVINSRRDEVDTLLKSMDQVSQLVSDNRNSVLLLLTRGEAIGAAVQQRQTLLTQLLDNVAAMSKLLQDMGIENNGELGPLIQNLNTMADGLTKNRENLDRLYEITPVALRQFNNVVGNGPYGEIWAPWIFPDNWLCFAQAVQGCN
ncbi:MCE family protein [Nocardia asteroides NBRC 15531]|uniref:Mce family protein n=1 Tax=Nocardia asteroides NBRC 15531 TaxID=1110697 RepID=U5EFS9_NOCAS|nr:MCE family protein [Nocardia asteroides]TLF67753.1 MCE family protein [Nocardia asteroides NBRC 15531]UGT52079.1 MCE family protein [Nocardia asteroides]SFN03354.1 virulence factor Mce family protein [Nocardia asteroides]VEG35210.1 virulence factor Mce family protein [Nocardia asteroides]GAD85241.1 Mce family protein [Nocardia asteroides NBRC 15531]